MPSLMELVERVNKGELIDPDQLEVYEDSPNTAEKFLAHHAHAMLDLRRAQQHMLQSLDAIDYSDQKVLNQFVSVSGFLGLTDTRAAPVIRFGSCAIARREYGLGIEAIQNGVAYDLQHGGAYTGDRENCQFIAAQYARVAQAVGWRSEQQSLDYNNKQTRIAYVVSGIADDEPSSRTIAGFARYIDSKRFRFQVYSTEAGVRRDKQFFAQSSYVQPSAKRGAAALEVLGRQKVPAWMAPTDTDVISAARELASQLVRDRIDVVIFDTTQADPVAALVADWEVARAKLNFCRRTPLFASGIDCICYTDQARYESDRAFWQKRAGEGGGRDIRCVMEGIDADEVLGPAPQRSMYGIPDSAVVLATAGQELDRTMSEEFVETAIAILRAHPNAVYLLIGEAELTWQKRKFESAGVSKRVGYAGRRKDLPGFLRIADVYLAEFPGSSASGVLQAMSMERAVVAMQSGESVEQSQAAAFAGAEAAIAGRDHSAYIERVSKLIREPQSRAKLAKSLRVRAEQQFGFSQTARQIEQLAEQLTQQASAAPAQNQQQSPFAQVA